MSECSCGNGRKTAEWFVRAAFLMSLGSAVAQAASLLAYGPTHEFAALYVMAVLSLLLVLSVLLMVARYGRYKAATLLASWMSFMSVMGMAFGDAVRLARGDAGAQSFPIMIVLLAFAIPIQIIVIGPGPATPYITLYGASSMALSLAYDCPNGAVVTAAIILAGVLWGRMSRKRDAEQCNLHRRIAHINRALDAMNGRYSA